jgi:hypothetical protein
MKSLQNYIEQMNQMLKELIQVATQLRDMSLQVISEEDLAPLQKRQEELLLKLESMDEQIQRDYRHQLPATMQEQFHAQLQIFQQLNQEFIQNLSASHGLIQFELRRLQDTEGQDFTRLSRLQKASPEIPEESEESEEKS